MTEGRKLPIKYIGSKRRLVPALGSLLSAAGARTALDLFTGTTRVVYEFKKRGANVTALDSATYSKVFADCYIGTDSLTIDKDDLRDALAHLQGLPGQPGYFTETFCVQSRYFRPEKVRRSTPSGSDRDGLPRIVPLPHPADESDRGG